MERRAAARLSAQGFTECGCQKELKLTSNSPPVSIFGKKLPFPNGRGNLQSSDEWGNSLRFRFYAERSVFRGARKDSLKPPRRTSYLTTDFVLKPFLVLFLGLTRARQAVTVPT